MKKLIALLPTEGKTKEQIIAEATGQLRDKGYLKDDGAEPQEPESTSGFTEYEDRDAMLLEALKRANPPK